MNTNINNLTIEYDEGIIRKIKELIENGLNKLKTVVKSKIKPNLSFYNELDQEFDYISLKLEELNLLQELRYFLSIKRMILYIIYKNSYDNHFGHCNFALELLTSFINMFKTNIKFYENGHSINEYEFEKHLTDYKKKYHDYRRVYYQSIYEPNERYSEKKLYETLKDFKEWL